MLLPIDKSLSYVFVYKSGNSLAGDYDCGWLKRSEIRERSPEGCQLFVGGVCGFAFVECTDYFGD